MKATLLLAYTLFLLICGAWSLKTGHLLRGRQVDQMDAVQNSLENNAGSGPNDGASRKDEGGQPSVEMPTGFNKQMLLASSMLQQRGGAVAMGKAQAQLGNTELTEARDAITLDSTVRKLSELADQVKFVETQYSPDGMVAKDQIKWKKSVKKIGEAMMKEQELLGAEIQKLVQDADSTSQAFREILPLTTRYF